jgi:hypothetical protein
MGLLELEEGVADIATKRGKVNMRIGESCMSWRLWS